MSRQDAAHGLLVAEARAALDATEALVEAMQRSGISRAELARAAGVSDRYLRDVLAHKRKLSINRFGRLAAALGESARIEIDSMGPD